MRSPTWVLGYHGCDRKVAEAVLAGTTVLQTSENDYDWLGTGIYFWENNPERALHWAEFSAANPRYFAKPVREPAVIGAVIDLGNCLDLLEAESLRLVWESHGALKQILAATGQGLPSNAGRTPDRGLRRLDCAVINTLHLMRKEAGEPPFDSVRAAFIEGEPLYTGAGFHAQTHLQLCIRTEAQIVGYFRVREEEVAPPPRPPRRRR